jgi:hypothetical protein
MKMSNFSIRSSWGGAVAPPPAGYTIDDLDTVLNAPRYVPLLFPMDNDIILEEHTFKELRTTGTASVDGTVLKKDITFIFGDDSPARATELHGLLGLSISSPRMFKLQNIGGTHAPFSLLLGNASDTHNYLKFRFMEKDANRQVIFVDSAESNTYFTATWERDKEKNDIIIFNIVSQGSN